MKTISIFDIEVDPDFDVVFYQNTYPETHDFYQPYCAENGIDDRQRLFYHYVNHGVEGRYFKSLAHMLVEKLRQGEPLPEDFSPQTYRMLNSDMSSLSDVELIQHYLLHGVHEQRRYRLSAGDMSMCGRTPLFINHDVSLTGAPIFLYEFVAFLKDRRVFSDPIIVDPYPSQLFAHYEVTRLYHYNNIERLSELLSAYNPPLIYSNSLNLFFQHSERLKKYLPKTLFHFHESIENVPQQALKPIRQQKIYVVSSRISEQFRKAGCKHVSIFPPFIKEETQARIQKEARKSCFLRNAFRGIDRSRVVVGMAGSIVKRKGFSLFYKTAQKNPEIEFIWVGGEANWRVKAAQCYQEDFAELPNLFHVPFDQNPYKYFSVFDYLFLTSLNDPCPIVVLEALVLNKNVVVLKDNIYCDHSAAGLPNYFQIDNRGKSEDEIIHEATRLFRAKGGVESQSGRYIAETFTAPRLLQADSSVEHYLILSYYLRPDAVAEIDYFINLLNGFNLIQRQKWGIVISVQVPEGDDINQRRTIDRFNSVLNLKKVFTQVSRGWDSLGFITGLEYVFSQCQVSSKTRVAYVHNKSNLLWRDELFRILYESPDDINSCDSLVSQRFYVNCDKDDLNRELFKRYPIFLEAVEKEFSYIQGACFISKLEYLKPLFEGRESIKENLTDVDKIDDFWLSIMKDDLIFERYYNFYRNNVHNSPIDMESKQLVKEGVVKNYFELLQKFGMKGIPDCQFEHALERYVGYLISHEKRVKTVSWWDGE